MDEPSEIEVERDFQGNITKIIYIHLNIVLYALIIERDVKGNIIRIAKSEK